MAAWQASGTVLIACNCDWGCPCNFNARPTKGKCEGGWMWSIEQGSFDDVSLDGLALAVFCDWPAAIHEGGGQAVAYVDERADDRQREALTTLVRGQAEGPWAIFINTYALDGPHAARFDINLADYETRLTIGDSIELEFDAIRNPVTNAEVHPELVLPEGLVIKRGSIATSKVFRVSNGLSFDHSGQNTTFARFDYEVG